MKNVIKPEVGQTLGQMPRIHPCDTEDTIIFLERVQKLEVISVTLINLQVLECCKTRHVLRLP